MQSLSRRDALRAAAAAATSGALVPAGWVRAAAPEPQAITAELIAAAQREGKVSFYTSVDLPVAEKVAKAFEARFPNIAVRVERTGAERNFQRIAQEYASRIYACDVTQSSDAAHFITWKRDGLLEAYLPEEVAKHYPPQHRDLDAKWMGKLVKAHPGYSGTIMTATQQMVAALGWGFFEKLAKQKVMQVQSAADPPKKVAAGERAVQIDGADYTILQLQDKGEPVEIVYATEGSPLITG